MAMGQRLCLGPGPCHSMELDEWSNGENTSGRCGRRGSWPSLAEVNAGSCPWSVGLAEWVSMSTRVSEMPSFDEGEPRWP